MRQFSFFIVVTGGGVRSISSTLVGWSGIDCWGRRTMSQVWVLFVSKWRATGATSLVRLKMPVSINERARAADRDPDFSRRIRDGLPGM